MHPVKLICPFLLQLHPTQARLASGEDGAARTWGLGPQGSTAAALDAAFALQSANRRIEQVAAQFAHLPARTQPSRDQAHQDNVI